jgi:hypothetical protein
MFLLVDPLVVRCYLKERHGLISLQHPFFSLCLHAIVRGDSVETWFNKKQLAILHDTCVVA